MGGNVPLGYDADGRTLKVNRSESETIRKLFDLYIECGSIRRVRDEADRLGLRPKSGGKPFGRGHLHYILTNPVYIGRIRHRSQTFDGRHPAIVDIETWEAVQRSLADTAARRRGKGNSGAHRSLLAGKLADETGDRLTPSHTKRHGRRYRYYVSNRLVTRAGKEVTNDGSGWRLPAQELESRISSAIANILRKELCGKLLIDSPAHEIRIAQSILENVTPGDRGFQRALLDECLSSAIIRPGVIEMTLDADGTARLLRIEPVRLDPSALRFCTTFRFRKRAMETRLVIGGESSAEIDPVLIRNIARAHQFYAELRNGRRFVEIATSANISRRRLVQVLNMAFLAPDIVKAILDGRQPAGLTTEWLQRNSLPSDWNAQRRLIASLQ